MAAKLTLSVLLLLLVAAHRVFAVPKTGVFNYTTNAPPAKESLDVCHGDCDYNVNCKVGLLCKQRTFNSQTVHGCTGTTADVQDYCFDPWNDPKFNPFKAYYTNLTNTVDDARFLNKCQGDCDDDTDCLGNLKCFKRQGFEPVPGCEGTGVEGDDYCYDPSGWQEGTTTIYKRTKSTITIQSPSTNPDNMLFLFLGRDGGMLPLELDGWTRAAECFKGGNSQATCFVASDCVTRDGNFCYKFPNDKNGTDLASVVYYKVASAATSYPIYVSGTKPAWAIMTAVSGVNQTDPVRNVATQSCDNVVKSIFPSVWGAENDILLLSMIHDDGPELAQFSQPNTTELLGYEEGLDAAGFLYGKKLTADGETGTLKTEGSGAGVCKDIMISMTLRAATPAEAS